MTHETGLVIAILIGGTGGFLVVWLLQRAGSMFLKILSALFGAVAAGVVFIAVSLFRAIFMFLGDASPTGTLVFTVAMTMIAVGVAGFIRLVNWYRFR